MRARFPLHSLWLLLLIPGNALVALDLAHAVVRPGVWLVRFAPVLLVLGVVAFAHGGASAFAIRLRKELRLALPMALLALSSSGAVLCVDALPEGALREVLRTLPQVLALVLPVALVLMPMSAERERGTLQELLTLPGGGRAFAEKFALSALLVVVSWLELSTVAERGSDLWWFALGGHLLALATAPAWFFSAPDEGTALGFVVLLPIFLAGIPALVWSPAALPVLVIYAVVMLGWLPHAIRQGAAAPPPLWMRVSSSALPWVERLASPLWRAELRGQRDALSLNAFAALAYVTIQLADSASQADASMVLIAFCAVAALLSPVLAFTEARRLGTLDTELSMRPRREVFFRRAKVSLLCSGLASVVMPLALMAPESFSDALMLALMMSLAWTVGLAVAVHLRGVGTALAAGLGLGAAMLVSHVGLLVLTSYGAQRAMNLEAWPNLVPFMLATLVVIGATATAVAARRFLKADRVEPRIILAAVALSLTHAAVLGAAGVAISLL